MDLSLPQTGTQSYQAILYNRALHPSLFDLRSRRVRARGPASLEAWVLPGQHVLRFTVGQFCATELLTDREDDLPESGAVTAFLCAGEREFEHVFTESRVTYMASVHTETISETIYAATYRDMLEHAAANESQIVEWTTPEGRNMSVVDLEAFGNEIHAEAYHLLARGGFVLRIQSMFRHG
jgi:hypothetical protein